MLKELGPAGINALNQMQTPEDAAVWFHDNFEKVQIQIYLVEQMRLVKHFHKLVHQHQW